MRHMNVIHRTDAMRWRIYFLLLCCMLLGLLPAGAAYGAQNAPITFAVQAAFDGTYRAGEWFPVDVQIANDGPDVRGVLEWRFPGQNEEMSFQREIELPRGARKRVTLYAFSRNFARNGEVRLLDGNTVLAQQDVLVEAKDPSVYLIGVVSSDPALLNSLNSLKVVDFNDTNVLHFGLDMLPDQAAALMTLNALYLHDLDTSTLQAGQRDALSLWVQAGGQLIVSGGVNGPQVASGVADLLPVELDSGLSQGSLAALGQIGTGGAPPTAQTALNNVRPRANAAPLAGNSGTALLYRQALGSGSVTFTTFDLASLRGWTGEGGLWQNLLKPTQMQSIAAESRLSQNNLLQRVLRSGASSLPSAALLLLLLAMYLVIIGPLNYLVLRRLGRLDWAWLTIPVLVLFFSAAFYLVGFGLRGGQSQLNQIAIVSATEGQPRGMATAYVGLFSPRRTRYTVQFPAETLVSEARSWRDSGDSVETVRYTDAAVEVADVLVDVGSVRTLVAETMVDVPVSVQSALRMQSGDVTGTVQNIGAEPLEDARIIRDRSIQSLGTIAPGQTAQVSLRSADFNFPGDTSLDPIDSIQREELLSTIFQRNLNQTNTDGSVYLVAWRHQPSVPLSLNGQAATQEGTTLYVVRLAGK